MQRGDPWQGPYTQICRRHEVEIQGETAVTVCGLSQSLGVTAHHGTASSVVTLKSSAPQWPWAMQPPGPHLSHPSWSR